MRAKEEDKVLVEAETRKMAQDDQARAQYFQHLKEYQVRNEQKLSALSNYQAQGNIGDAAKRDEASMLKNIADRAAREELES